MSPNDAFTRRILIFTLLTVLFWLPATNTHVAAQSGAEEDKDVLFLPAVSSNDESGNGIPEGYVLIEEDILVPVEFVATDGVRSSAVWEVKFWPKGIVPFEFASNVSTANRQHAIDAMALWENVANIDFRQCADNQCTGTVDNYIHLQNSSRNSSPVGMQGSEQVLNLYNWGWPFIIAHELGHALGLYHEQSRHDRASFITIIKENVDLDADQIAVNFGAEEDGETYPLGVYDLPGDKTYDFDSVMHYGQYSFSKCKPEDVTAGSCPKALLTVQVKAPYSAKWQGKIGQRDHLSRLDELTMSFLYPEKNWYFLDHTETFPLDIGSFRTAYRTMGIALASTPANSVLWIQPGTYDGPATYSKPMSLRASLGGVTLR